MRIDYTKLRPGMLVVCGGDTVVSKFIRGVTSGFKRWRDRDTATHVGIVVEFKGRFFIAESVGDKFENGLRLSPFGKYLKDDNKYLIDIMDAHRLSYSDRQLIEQQIAKDLDYVLEYDYRGVISFVFDRVKEDKKRVYCSEYAYQLTAPYLPYPIEFEARVSPEDLRNVSHWVSVPSWNLGD